MIRWLAAVALASLAACAPDPEKLCQPVQERCVVVILREWMWRELPRKLAPDESVVEVAFEDATEVVVPWLSSEIRQTLFGEEEQVCTRHSRVSISRYRVQRLVSGPFTGPAFVAVHHTEGCDSDGPPMTDATARARELARFYKYDGPLHMVIHPTNPSGHLGSEVVAKLKNGPPLMNLREAGRDP